jgi:hypothetical protein
MSIRESLAYRFLWVGLSATAYWLTCIMMLYWLLRKRWQFLFSLAISILIGWMVLTNNIGFRFNICNFTKAPRLNVIRADDLQRA